MYLLQTDGAEVYPDPQVAAALNDFQLIAVDVTETNAQSRELLNHFNLFGPPSLLLFSQGKEVREARIQGEVTAQTSFSISTRSSAGGIKMNSWSVATVQPALNTFLSCRVAIVVKQLFKSQISHVPRLLDSG